MKKIFLFLFSFFFSLTTSLAQENQVESKTKQGHTDQNKFRQLKDLLATPNDQHTASGAPGHQYSQQKVDYIMDIRLEESTNKVYGHEKITYHNNSKDQLTYLWVQLDQNMRANDSKTPLSKSTSINLYMSPDKFQETYMEKDKGFGFNIEKVESDGKPLSHFIHRTMMRINLPQPLASGDTFKFSIQWNYKINDINKDGGRSGLETFPDGNNNYTIAQFFPRLAVYNNVEGWQNMQFWGRSEWALEFGDYEVNLTVPADHIVDATGVLQNEKNVLTKEQRKRWEKARTSFEKPVLIVTQAEAEKAEKGRSNRTKTWKFKAKNVRDFAFASSRKYIWDAMATNVNGKTVMAV